MVQIIGLSHRGWLKANLSKRDPNTPPSCPHCPGVKETADHFIGNCPYYSTLRFQIFGNATTTITEIITNNKISKLEKYIKKSRRIDNDYYPTESEPNP